MNDEGIKQDMPGRVARWADLEGITGGHPDSGYDGYDRKLYSVIGFGPPDDVTSGDPESGKHHVSSPAGSLSSAKTAVDIDEGLNVAFLEGRTEQRGRLPLPRHERDLRSTRRQVALLLGRGRGRIGGAWPPGHYLFSGPCRATVRQRQRPKGHIAYDYRWQQAARVLAS